MPLHRLFFPMSFLFVEYEQTASRLSLSLSLFRSLPFSPSALHVCYLPVAIPPGTGLWLNLWPPEREKETEEQRERERERESWRPRGWLGVEGQLPAPFAKPAMGTTASIHIQILPGGRSKEAIDGGMEGSRGEGGALTRWGLRARRGEKFNKQSCSSWSQAA